MTACPPVMVSNLASCTQYYGYWVAWDSYRVRFGKGEVVGENKLMDCRFSNSFLPVGISFASASPEYTGWYLMDDRGSYKFDIIMWLFNYSLSI